MSGADAVKEDRLWQRHVDMAKLGGTPKGGVNRQALSAEDAAARNLLGAWARARGFTIFTDAMCAMWMDSSWRPIQRGVYCTTLVGVMRTCVGKR